MATTALPESSIRWGNVQSELGKMIDGKFVMRDVMGHLEGQMFITDSQSIYSRIGDLPGCS